MKQLALVLAFAPACVFADDPPPGPPPPPKPFVGQIVPDSGAYGTEITILGTGFGPSGDVMFTGTASDYTHVITSWTDTEIHVRVPFPAQPGPLTIDAPGGKTDTPAFTPTSTWTLGNSIAAPNAIVESRGFGSAFCALALGAKLELLVIDGSSATTYPLDGIAASADRRQPVRARLVADELGGPAVLATDNNSALALYTLGNNLVTKHDASVLGTLVTAGRDATGMFAWLQIVDTSNPQSVVYEIERARPGATVDAPWHIDRGPFNSIEVLDAAIASDGTLVAAYSQYDGNVFDNTATLGITRLAPAATGFAATEYPDGLAYDDYIASARVAMAGDGQRMIVDWSTQQYDETTDHTHPPFLRQAAGTWLANASAVDPALDGGAFTFTQTSIATAQAGPDGVVVTPDVANSGAITVPVWPADPIAIVADGTGTLRPLIRAQGKVWFPAPPAQP